MLTITVNGDIKRVDAGTSVKAFLEGIELDPTKVAVERNLEIVPKSTFADVALSEGDQLEIVHFIGGG
jgi:thiamine biosynthesis protein ThiS